MLELLPSSFAHVQFEAADVNMDLSSVTFAKPAAIVAFATKVEELSRAGVRVTVTPPLSSDTANYLCRVRLPQALNALGVGHTFGSVRERPRGHSIVELSRFSDAQTVSGLAASIYTFASQYDAAVAAALHTAVCEAGDNVGAHAGVPYGYLLAQYFPARREFQFSLGDSGVGFFGTLDKVGARDPQDALRLAAMPGVSSTGDTGRGYGISAVRENLADLRGSLVLATADQYRFFSRSRPDGTPAAARGAIAGSLIFGALSV